MENLAVIIDKVIIDALEKELKESKIISPIIHDLLDYCIAIAEGGKRIRGAFLYYSYLMCGGKDREEILKTTAFIELIHSYLLIHDDIMDNADLRRSTHTIHRVYRDLHFDHKFPGDSAHFGQGIGIVAGDILNHIGARILVNSNFPAEYKIKALDRFNKKITVVGYGQVLDEFNEVKEVVTEEDVMQVHLYKTGYYTYELPLHLGAILAGANGDNLKALTEYSIPGGIAFQIQDDILGMYGDEEKLGKSADSDLKEGKQTLLIIKAMEKASGKDKLILKNALGNPNATKETLDTVRKIIIDTGSFDYSKETAIKLVKNAIKGLNKYENPEWNPEGKNFLEGIAEYMIHREL